MRLRRRLRNADYWLFFAVLALAVTGLLVIHSTTADTPREGLFQRHLVSLAVGFVVFVVMSSVHYRHLDTIAYLAYAGAVVLLACVLLFGISGFGAKRWLVLGPIRLQPAELAKIATLLALARFLAGRRVDPTSTGSIARILALAIVPVALILQQPDLGTALAFAGLVLAVAFWAGMPVSWLAYMGALLLAGVVTFRLPPLGLAEPEIAAVLAELGSPESWWMLLALFGALLLSTVVILRWRGASRRLVIGTVLLHLAIGLGSPHAWNRLEPYQQSRVMSFLNPGSDPSGAGYQVIQSKIAIGSGRIAGKGYLKGTQKALAYLPQQHTDFVFSVVGEEFGFVGSTLVVGLFLLLLLRGVRIARHARDRFASLLAAGAVGILAYHVFVNLFMTMGLAPVTGLPLPFISYGGSFLVLTMALLGMLESVAMRRHAY